MRASATPLTLLAYLLIAELPRNLAVRHRLSEIVDAFVGDLGAAEGQTVEVGQFFEMLQPSVGDLGVVEIQFMNRPQAPTVGRRPCFLA